MKSRFLPLFFFFCVCVIFVVKWWESYLVDERMAGRFTGKKVSRSNDSVTEKSLQGKMCRGEKIALLSRPMSMVSVMWCVRSLPFFFTFCQVQFFEWRRRRKKRGGGGKERKREKKISTSLRGVVKNLFITKLMPELPKSHCATDAPWWVGWRTVEWEGIFVFYFLPVCCGGGDGGRVCHCLSLVFLLVSFSFLLCQVWVALETGLAMLVWLWLGNLNKIISQSSQEQQIISLRNGTIRR